MGGQSKDSTETEVKIPLTNQAATAERLKQAGFRISVEREWESNDLFDTEDQVAPGQADVASPAEVW